LADGFGDVAVLPADQIELAGDKGGVGHIHDRKFALAQMRLVAVVGDQYQLAAGGNVVERLEGAEVGGRARAAPPSWPKKASAERSARISDG
jgi:hypothetical protein